RLEIVKRGRRADGIAKCPVAGHVGDALAIDVDVAPVAQARDVVLPCPYRNHFSSIWLLQHMIPPAAGPIGKVTITRRKVPQPSGFMRYDACCAEAAREKPSRLRVAYG